MARGQIGDEVLQFGLGGIGSPLARLSRDQERGQFGDASLPVRLAADELNGCLECFLLFIDLAVGVSPLRDGRKDEDVVDGDEEGDKDQNTNRAFPVTER